MILHTVRKRLFRTLALRVAEKLLRIAHVPIRFENVELSTRINALNALRQRYPRVEAPDAPRQRLHVYEAKVRSQHGEDGILLHLFDALGCHDRRFIEFGVEDGTECNTANLSLHFGWRGMLIEGDPAHAAKARAFYRAALGGRGDRVQIVNSFVTAENINGLLKDNGFTGDIDLLSIDIDGNDYWVWRAIDAVRPRVVVIEYNSVFGNDRAVTIPYDPAFSRGAAHVSKLYYGASLPALAHLGREKGYALAGCDSQGVNAFFVRNELADRIDTLSPEEAFVPQWTRLREAPLAEHYEKIRHLPLQDVSSGAP